ncbi:MAG: PEGA domain-containing protein [Kofleriaceae bacterium]
MQSAGGPPQRGGTPKIIPILVSIGVAAGTFSGLYFGLGTKSDEVAAAGDGAGTNGSATPGTDPAGPGLAANTGGDPPPPAVAIDAGVDAAEVAAAPVDAGVDAAAVVTPPAAQVATLQVTIDPADVGGEVTVDGKPLDSGKATIELVNGKKTVRVIGKASGYRTFDKKMTIDGDSTVTVKLVKRSGSSGGSTRPPHTGGKGPGGKIDL